MSDSRYPSLYQINTRVWLTDISRTLGREATLDDISDADPGSRGPNGIQLALSGHEQSLDRVY